jgi:hypothetical protein
MQATTIASISSHASDVEIYFTYFDDDYRFLHNIRYSGLDEI